MIEFLPLPRIYHLYGIPITIWAVMACISITLFVIVYFNQIKKYNLDQNHAFHMLVHFAFWGLIGLHLYKIFFVEYKPDMIIQYGRVGLDSFGAILGFIAIAIYLYIFKLEIARYLDLIALPIIVAATTQRISDSLINDKAGVIATLPWSVFYYGEPRHPIGIYYFLVSLIILVIVYNLSKRKLKPGNLMLWTGMLYSSTRFLLEFYRAIPEHKYHGLSIHQLAFGSVFIFLLLIYIVRNEWYRKVRYIKKAAFTFIVSLLFPKGRGDIFLKIYIYFRFVDDIIDDPRHENRDQFLAKQYRFIDAIYSGVEFDRWRLRFEQRGIYDAINSLSNTKKSDELNRHIYELMSTFKYDLAREGRYIHETEFMEYSRKIGDCYAFAFTMLFDISEFEKIWDKEFVKMTGKTLFEKTCDYAHYAHLLHSMKDSDADSMRRIYSYPKGKKKIFFSKLVTRLDNELSFIDHRVFDAITNPLLRFATRMYYWRFSRIMHRLKKKFS